MYSGNWPSIASVFVLPSLPSPSPSPLIHGRTTFAKLADLSRRVVMIVLVVVLLTVVWVIVTVSAALTCHEPERCIGRCWRSAQTFLVRYCSSAS